MTRLNGWQRLWVVLFALWTCGVAAVAWQKWPSALDAIAWQYFGGPAIQGQSWFDFSPTEPLDLPIGAEVPHELMTPPPRADAVVQQRLRDSRLAAARFVVSLWLLPPVALYLLVWSLGWVRRGFADGGAQ